MNRRITRYSALPLVATQLALCCLLIGVPFSRAQQPPDNRPFLPPPRAVNPGAGGQPPSVPPQPPRPAAGAEGCTPLTDGALVCKRTLRDYVEGDFDNADIKSFSEGVAERIHHYEETRGRESIREISVLGVADGLRNRGRKSWSAVPDECRGDRQGPLLDPGLAEVRGCLVRNQIKKALSNRFLINHVGLRDETPLDIDDGGVAGPKVRRVEVTFRVAGGRR